MGYRISWLRILVVVTVLVVTLLSSISLVNASSESAVPESQVTSALVDVTIEADGSVIDSPLDPVSLSVEDVSIKSESDTKDSVLPIEQIDKLNEGVTDTTVGQETIAKNIEIVDNDAEVVVAETTEIHSVDHSEISHEGIKDENTPSTSVDDAIVAATESTLPEQTSFVAVEAASTVDKEVPVDTQEAASNVEVSGSHSSSSISLPVDGDTMIADDAAVNIEVNVDDQPQSVPTESETDVLETDSKEKNEDIGTPKCPSRSHIIYCSGKYLDTDSDGKLSRSELETAIGKLPWYGRGILKLLGSVDKIMEKCDVDKDGYISMDYDMIHNSEKCLASCFKRRSFKSAFFKDCQE